MNTKCSDGHRVVVKTAGSRAAMSCSCGASTTGSPSNVAAAAAQHVKDHNKRK